MNTFYKDTHLNIGYPGYININIYSPIMTPFLTYDYLYYLCILFDFLNICIDLYFKGQIRKHHQVQKRQDRRGRKKRFRKGKCRGGRERGGGEEELKSQ